MKILKVTIPTSALLITALMAGTAIANNETGASTVEELIINDTLSQNNPLLAPQDAQSYQIASADSDENECEDEDEDEDEDDDQDEDATDDEDEDEADEYASCSDQGVATQG